MHSRLDKLQPKFLGNLYRQLNSTTNGTETIYQYKNTLAAQIRYRQLLSLQEQLKVKYNINFHIEIKIRHKSNTITIYPLVAQQVM